MQIRVVGSNMEVGQALTSYVEEHLAKSVTKHFDKAVKAEVYFSKEGLMFRALIVVNEGVKGGIVVKSNAEAGDVHAAFNEANNKASHQLRRYKGRLKNYRRNGGIKAVEPSYAIFDATKYVLPSASHDVFAEMENEESESHVQETSLKVISEKNTSVEELTVDEAVMKMDLADLPALVFINSQNKRLNVVYHRKDGNISWIDPNK